MKDKIKTIISSGVQQMDYHSDTDTVTVTCHDGVKYELNMSEINLHNFKILSDLKNKAAKMEESNGRA